MGLLWYVLIAARKLLPAWRVPRHRLVEAVPLSGSRHAPGWPAAPIGRGHGASAVTQSITRCRNPLPGVCEARRPLRVVRVRESGQLPGRAGRMTISGRMADVCAELDRLAAHEDLSGSP